MHNERVMDVVIAVRYCVLNPQYGPSTRQSTASRDEQKHRVDEIMSRIRQLGRLKKFLFFLKKKKKKTGDEIWDRMSVLLDQLSRG